MNRRRFLQTVGSSALGIGLLSQQAAANRVALSDFNDKDDLLAEHPLLVCTGSSHPWLPWRRKKYHYSLRLDYKDENRPLSVLIKCYRNGSYVCTRTAEGRGKAYTEFTTRGPINGLVVKYKGIYD